MTNSLYWMTAFNRHVPINRYAAIDTAILHVGKISIQCFYRDCKSYYPLTTWYHHFNYVFETAHLFPTHFILIDALDKNSIYVLC